MKYMGTKAALVGALSMSFLATMLNAATKNPNIALLNKTNHAIWYGIGWKTAHGTILVDAMRNFQELKAGEEAAYEDNRANTYITQLYIYPYAERPVQGNKILTYAFNPGKKIHIRLKEKNNKLFLEPQTKFTFAIKNNVTEKDIKAAGKGEISYGGGGVVREATYEEPKPPVGIKRVNIEEKPQLVEEEHMVPPRRLGPQPHKYEYEKGEVSQPQKGMVERLAPIEYQAPPKSKQAEYTTIEGQPQPIHIEE